MLKNLLLADTLTFLIPACASAQTVTINMVVEFPKEYKHWIRHEIGICMNRLFINIPEEDRLMVWTHIEEHYLKKYHKFVRIDFDWGSSGIWLPPFPGSVASGRMCPVENYYPLPENIKKRLFDWVDYRDNNSFENDSFDFKSSDAEGLAVTMEIRQYLPETVYLEFLSSFEEIKIINGKSVKLEIPGFLSRYYTSGTADFASSGV